jgi:inorganic pyrophosphatase
VMQMVDRGVADDKIIAVAEQDPSVSEIDDISDLPQYLLSELTHFFENYKTLENKKVVIDQFLPKQKAFQIIEESLTLYRKTFRK